MLRFISSRVLALPFVLWSSCALARETIPQETAKTASEASEEQKGDNDPRLESGRLKPRLTNWRSDPARWFVSARVDFGYLFVRPRASVGYGMPHQHWVGLDAVPILSTQQGGGYLGLRYRHPRFEVRSGALYSSSFSRTFLEPAESFDALDLETHGDDLASYLAWDSEISFSFQAGYGYVFSETQGIYLPTLADNKYVFVETIGTIVAPRWAGRQQLGYSLAIPGVSRLYVGPSVEAVISPDRTKPLVIRAGAVVVLWLYRDLQLRTDVLPTVYSPDTLGRTGAPWMTITARFLWASGGGVKPEKK